MASARFRNFCWLALAYVVAAPAAATLVELSHRVTSGGSAVLVLVLLVWARRELPKGHAARGAAIWVGVFMLIEVAMAVAIAQLDSPSVARALWMALHSVDTLLLIGAMTLTVHYASGAPRARLRGAPLLVALALVALLATLFVSASGAVAALGDALLPAKDLGSAADLSPAAHLLVRLREVHPVAAVLLAFVILSFRFVIGTQRSSPAVTRWGTGLRVLVVAQLAAGLANMMLPAPTWLPVVHALLAHALWIALVLLVACGFAEQPEPDDIDLLEEPI